MRIDLFDEDFLRIGIDAPDGPRDAARGEERGRKVRRWDPDEDGPGRIGLRGLERAAQVRSLEGDPLGHAKSRAPNDAIGLHRASKIVMGRGNPNYGVSRFAEPLGGKPPGAGKPDNGADRSGRK